MKMLEVRLFLISWVLLYTPTLQTSVVQIDKMTDTVRLGGNEDLLQTWYNRRLHTMTLWIHRQGAEGISLDKWFTLEPFFHGPQFNTSEDPDIYFSWNVGRRVAYTYMDFVNVPLGLETVNLRITTNMFDLENATKPMNESEDYVKFTFMFNATHIHLWVNEVLAIKLFLRDIPLDIGNAKWFKLGNTTSNDFSKIYYYDPTVYCWDDCYEDDLPNKFHFDRLDWLGGKYSDDDMGGSCQIVNCTQKMLEKQSTPSTHSRCVRLYHTEQGRSDQKVKLLCTNENYTYTACNQYPDKPCWYEVCDNYDLCNSAPGPSQINIILGLFFLISSILLPY